MSTGRLPQILPRDQRAPDAAVIRAHQRRLATRVLEERMGRRPRWAPMGTLARDSAAGRARIARELTRLGVIPA